MDLRIARNIMVGAGAFYLLERWLTNPLALGFFRLTGEHIYVGNFSGYVVMPIVGHLPQALVAVAVGGITIWLVESDQPAIWVIVPVFLYALTGFVNHHWSRPPGGFDRLSETIGALFPALTCVAGGFIAKRYITTPEKRPSTS